MNDHFSRKFGNLTFTGKLLPAVEGFEVTVRYANHILVNKIIMDIKNNSFPFSYIPSEGGEYAARGMLCYCKDSTMEIPELFVTLTAPVGVNLKLYPVKPPPPSPPPPGS